MALKTYSIFKQTPKDKEKVCVIIQPIYGPEFLGIWNADLKTFTSVEHGITVDAQNTYLWYYPEE